MIIVIVLTIYGNSVFLNVNFINRNSYFKLFKAFLEIDEFIGIGETKFMRDVTHKLFRLQITFYFIITFLSILVITYLYNVHIYQSYIIALFMGILLIAILSGVQIYIHFFIISYIFLCMRVRFLNISLLKLYNLDRYNIFTRKTLFFDGIIWKEHFIDSIELNSENLEHAYRLVFKLLRRLEDTFRFLVSISIRF